MSRILITGGNGFIGSNLALKLEGNEIVILDNLSSSKLNKNNKTEFINGDVLDFDFHKLGKFDEIYHLACPASPVQYMKNPINTINVNITGTQRVLEYALKCNTKMVFTSTSEVYGNPEISPQPESYLGNVNTVGPRACYDGGKRVAETLCYEYQKLGLDIRVTRLFNTYGPYMQPDDGRIISNWISKLLKNESIEIHGGNQTRSFCYVDDTVDALIKVMALPKSKDLTLLNVGNPSELSLFELLEVFKTFFTDIKYNLTDYREDDPMKRKPDITKLQKSTNFNPNTNLLDGLKKTIEYFKDLK